MPLRDDGPAADRDGARPDPAPHGSPDAPIPAESDAPTVEKSLPAGEAGAPFLAPGTVISHYEIRSPLGRGGMGEVYAAFDLTLRRPVALKAIRAERRLHAQARARFLREARMLSRLDHPHICRIFDYVEGDRSDFIVLELIEGEALSAALERGLDAGRKMEIAEQINEALGAAHAVGIVHRDLKPSNVMLAERGGVKVLDFGLASSPETDAAPSEEAGSTEADDRGAAGAGASPPPGPIERSGFRSAPGVLTGTLPYMSPEQARAEAPQPASDMYAFGLVLQELFTGRAAYPRDVEPATLLEMVREGRTLPPAGVSRDLAELMRRLTSLAPSRRPTAVETADRLRLIREKPARLTRRLVAAAAVVVAVVAGIKYTVDLRWERAIADQRRNQAETLVEFMLGDLREKLEPMGRLDILDDVGDQAIEYFATVPEMKLSDEELLSRSKALYQIGEVRLLQDDADLGAALDAFQESLALSRALVAADPESVDRRFRLSQSEFWVGYVHWKRGQLDEAQEHFAAYLEIAQWLVEREPDNPEWRLELSYANSNLGSVLEARGALGAALERYLETLAVNEALADLDPSKLEWKEQLAEQHNLVGAVQLQLGALDRALAHFRSDLKLKKELTAADPGDFGWLNGLANAHNWVAQVLLARGEVDDALGHLRADLEITGRLVAQDESNTRHWRNLGRTRHALAKLHLVQGRPEEATAEARESLRILSKLAAQDPTNLRWRLDHAEAEANLARALLAMGRPAAAGNAARAASARLDLPPGPSSGPGELTIAAEVLSLLAEISAGRAGESPPLEAWDSSLKVLERAVSTSRDTRLLDPWLRILFLGGRAAEASEVRDLLDEIGYRRPDYLEFLTRNGLTRADQ